MTLRTVILFLLVALTMALRLQSHNPLDIPPGMSDDEIRAKFNETYSFLLEKANQAVGKAFDIDQQIVNLEGPFLEKVKQLHQIKVQIHFDSSANVDKLKAQEDSLTEELREEWKNLQTLKRQSKKLISIGMKKVDKANSFESRIKEWQRYRSNQPGQKTSINDQAGTPTSDSSAQGSTSDSAAGIPK